MQVNPQRQLVVLCLMLFFTQPALPIVAALPTSTVLIRVHNFGLRVVFADLEAAATRARMDCDARSTVVMDGKIKTNGRALDCHGAIGSITAKSEFATYDVVRIEVFQWGTTLDEHDKLKQVLNEVKDSIAHDPDFIGMKECEGGARPCFF